MTPDTTVGSLAELIRYPAPGFHGRVAACGGRLAGEGPEAAAALAAFSTAISGLSEPELEELYTRTFDLDPACTLDTGWHLYGERYERGAYLVEMRGLLSKHGIPEGSAELPDHLTYALELLGRMPEGEGRALARGKILPVLGKVLKALEGRGEVYEGALRAVEAVLTRRFAAEER